MLTDAREKLRIGVGQPKGRWVGNVCGVNSKARLENRLQGVDDIHLVTPGWEVGKVLSTKDVKTSPGLGRIHRGHQGGGRNGDLGELELSGFDPGSVEDGSRSRSELIALLCHRMIKDWSSGSEGAGPCNLSVIDDAVLVLEPGLIRPPVVFCDYTRGREGPAAGAALISAALRT